MPAATSRRPVKYRNHWPRPSLANRSNIAAAPASLAPPAPMKTRATRPERTQSVMRRPLLEVAGSECVMVMRCPRGYIDVNMLDVNGRTRYDGQGMQEDMP